MATAAEIAKSLGGKRSNSGWMACCPAHDDRSPSLSLTERDGKLLVCCFAGCTQTAVINSLKSRNLWPKREPLPVRAKRERLGPLIAEHLYCDETGKVLYRITRHEPKTFRPWRPDGRGGWLMGMGKVLPVLYHLPEVIEAAIVFVVEGERDVETLRDWGFVATCNPMGAGKWRPEFNEVFRGKTAIVVPDNDAPGRQHAWDVIRGVRPFAAGTILFDVSGDNVKDISDWFAAGHSEVELVVKLEDGWRDLERMEVRHG